MDLADLNYLLSGDDFFYNGKYLGSINYICDDHRVGFYSVHVYNNNKPYNVPKKYMSEYYLCRLKYIRMTILRKKSISRLVHFTPINNLESILENGMLSRNSLDEQGLKYHYSDDIRLDGKLDYICNSISFPNYKMFFSKRKQNQNIQWAVLSIDSEILIDKFDTEFYRKNAASSDSLKYKYDPCSNDALEFMFMDYENRDPYIPENYTTDPQAEVLVKDIIHPSYIKCIDTNGFNDAAHSLARNSKVDYNPCSRLFTYRMDYRRW